MQRTNRPTTLTGAVRAFLLPFGVAGGLLTAQEPNQTSPGGAEEAMSPPETEAVQSLPEYLVTPTKFPARPEEVGSAITVIAGNELEARQIRSLEDALRLAPGVAFASTGQTGSNSSVFLRGVNSNQTQIVVDGIRINDSNILPGPFLGGAMAHGLDSLEILRGPQGALYGGEAVGGVIALTTPRGSGPLSGEFEALGGSFGSALTRFAADAEEGPLACAVSVGWETTENDRPNNDYERLFYATRFDYAIGERTQFGLTIRGAERDYGSPGSTVENDPDNRDEEHFLLVTASLDHAVNEAWQSRFIAGWLRQDLGFAFPPVGSTVIENEKVSLDWRNIVAWGAGHTTLVGLTVEETAVRNTGFGEIDEVERLLGVYLQQTLELGEALTLTGGGRWENYDSFGNVVTWRGTGAYRVEETGTILRGSVGSGFRAPSFFELYAQNPFFAGNPSLDPEEALGWDVGVEQTVGELGTLALTWFAIELNDLIVSDFAVSPATVVNLEDASTSGLEVEWRGSWADKVSYRLAYTYLEAENETAGERLLRRPAHTLGFDVQAGVTDRLTVGMGGYRVANRLDVDPLSFGTIPGQDYFLARIYGAYALRTNVDLQLRVENAFDAEYEEVAGFPGRGLGVYGGVKVRF